MLTFLIQSKVNDMFAHHLVRGKKNYEQAIELLSKFLPHTATFKLISIFEEMTIDKHCSKQVD